METKTDRCECGRATKALSGLCSRCRGEAPSVSTSWDKGYGKLLNRSEFAQLMGYGIGEPGQPVVPFNGYEEDED